MAQKQKNCVEGLWAQVEVNEVKLNIFALCTLNKKEESVSSQISKEKT